MKTALFALVGFAVWPILLVLFGLEAWRIKEVITGHRVANEFPSDEAHGPDWYQRAKRAHLNTLENLPVFAALVLTAAVTDLSHPGFATVALVVLTARIAQSLTHLISVSALAVNIRFTFYFVQVACFLWMGWVLLQHLAG